MSIPTLVPPVIPNYNSKKETVYRVLQSQFGDGYSQRTKDGINNVAHKPYLEFENMIPADADTLEAFFDGLAGCDPFYYTLPLESNPRLWITSGNPVRTYQGPNSITVAVTLMEVFDIV